MARGRGGRGGVGEDLLRRCVDATCPGMSHVLAKECDLCGKRFVAPSRAPLIAPSLLSQAPIQRKRSDQGDAFIHPLSAPAPTDAAHPADVKPTPATASRAPDHDKPTLSLRAHRDTLTSSFPSQRRRRDPPLSAADASVATRPEFHMACAAQGLVPWAIEEASNAGDREVLLSMACLVTPGVAHKWKPSPRQSIRLSAKQRSLLAAVRARGTRKP